MYAQKIRLTLHSLIHIVSDNEKSVLLSEYDKKVLNYDEIWPIIDEFTINDWYFYFIVLFLLEWKTIVPISNLNTMYAWISSSPWFIWSNVVRNKDNYLFSFFQTILDTILYFTIKPDCITLWYTLEPLFSDASISLYLPLLSKHQFAFSDSTIKSYYHFIWILYYIRTVKIISLHPSRVWYPYIILRYIT